MCTLMGEGFRVLRDPLPSDPTVIDSNNDDFSRRISIYISFLIMTFSVVRYNVINTTID